MNTTIFQRFLIRLGLCFENPQLEDEYFSEAMKQQRTMQFKLNIGILILGIYDTSVNFPRNFNYTHLAMRIAYLIGLVLGVLTHKQFKRVNECIFCITLCFMSYYYFSQNTEFAGIQHSDLSFANGFTLGSLELGLLYSSRRAWVRFGVQAYGLVIKYVVISYYSSIG
jgi:hypothetical protein